MITGYDTVQEAAQKLHELGARMVLVTLGGEGTLISYQDKVEIIESISIESIDSTGAGDAFIGAMLYQVANIGNMPSVTESIEMVRFANKVGALTCTKLGAIQALPFINEI